MLGAAVSKTVWHTVQTEQAGKAEAGQTELQKVLSDVAEAHGLPGFEPLLELSKTRRELQHLQQSTSVLERCPYPLSCNPILTRVAGGIS